MINASTYMSTGKRVVRLYLQYRTQESVQNFIISASLVMQHALYQHTAVLRTKIPHHSFGSVLARTMDHKKGRSVLLNDITFGSVKAMKVNIDPATLL